jgi:hypothetical protein
MSLLERAARISDTHTLAVAIRVLSQNRANPSLIRELQELSDRIKLALERPEKPDAQEDGRVDNAK